jgi:enoyl-CoA hydratase/carnithine racemase
VIESSKYVNVDMSKGLAKVTLNNPKMLNCVNIEMVHELMAQLPIINKAKAFWMEGAGAKAFCAGGDIKSLYLARQTNRKLLDEFFRDEFTLDYKLTKMKSLQISNWDGFVMGGGVGLSVFSPYRIATENTNFAMLESKIGFFTDVCGAYFLSRLRNNIGTYLGLTGMRLKG